LVLIEKGKDVVVLLYKHRHISFSYAFEPLGAYNTVCGYFSDCRVRVVLLGEWGTFAGDCTWQCSGWESANFYIAKCYC